MPGSSQVKRGRQKGLEVLPERVRQARLESGLSLAQVAEGEMTRAAIHLVETGRMRPSLRTLELIARKTGRPISYFLADGGATEEQRARRDELRRLADTEEFSAAIDMGERLIEEGLPAGIEADVRFCLGQCYVRIGDGARALPHMVAARLAYERARDQWMTAEALDQEACALHLSDDPRALRTALQARDTASMIRPLPVALLVRINLHLGFFHYRLHEWEKAAEAYEQGLRLANEAPNIRQLAMIHDGLGHTYQQLGQTSAALHHARRAYSFFASSKDVTDLIRAEHDLGSLLLKQGELAAAEPHLVRALELCNEREVSRQCRGYVLASLARLAIARGELGEAEGHLTEALQLARTHNERTHEATTWQLFGQLHMRRDEYAAADEAYAKAIELLQVLQLPERLMDCQVEYAEALYGQGRLEESISHWRGAAAAARRRRSKQQRTASA